MKTKNYDIKVTNTEEDIKKSLNGIDKRGINILFSRVLVNLKLGFNIFNIPYDTVFMSNRNELLLLLNEKDKSSLKTALEEKNINYHEVSFQEENFEYKKPQKNKEIVFARGMQTLRETLKESKKHGKKECIFYPNMRGNLNLKYYLRDDSKEVLITNSIKGLIELENKIILCTKQDENRNLNNRKILYVLNELGMIASIKNDTYYNSIKKEKELVK